MVNNRGRACTIAGRAYERRVARVCRGFVSPHMKDIPLCTQGSYELGGCSMKQDVWLNFGTMADVGVEVKRPTPDWIQMTVVPCGDTWAPKRNTKTSQVIQDIFMEHVGRIQFPVPTFIDQPITLDEWNMEKHHYTDAYVSIPDDTIAKAYRARGAHYIQVYTKGLYHTGEDVCGFGVPMFLCTQNLRMRCKRHGKKDANGRHIPSSVTVSFRPKLTLIQKSPFTLDDAKNMPRNLLSFL